MTVIRVRDVPQGTEMQEPGNHGSVAGLHHLLRGKGPRANGALRCHKLIVEGGGGGGIEQTTKRGRPIEPKGGEQGHNLPLTVWYCKKNKKLHSR